MPYLALYAMQLMRKIDPSRQQSACMLTRNASAASCRAATAVTCHRLSFFSGLTDSVISRTSRWKGAFLISNSVDLWYCRISLQHSSHSTFTLPQFTL